MFVKLNGMNTAMANSKLNQSLISELKTILIVLLSRNSFQMQLSVAAQRWSHPWSLALFVDAESNVD